MIYSLLIALLSFSVFGATSEDLILQKYAKPHREILRLIEEEETIDSDEYSDELKELYFKALNERADIILQSDSKIEDPAYNQYRTILTELEYMETEADEIHEKVTAHLKELEKRTFSMKKRVFADFISWQRGIDLNSSTAKNTIILTNSGLCLGGGVSFENDYFTYGADGCFFYGSGHAKEKKTPPQYKESHIAMSGVKASLSAGAFVSSARAEIGFKLPVLYNVQDLKNPPGGSWKLDDDSDLLVMASLYSRWPFEKFDLHTEFGTFLDQSSIFYSLGIGYKF